MTAVPDPRFRDQLAEAAAALVAHHVSPAIGWWRAADAQGETFDRALLADRYKRAAEAVLELARAEAEARVQAAGDQRAAEVGEAVYRFGRALAEVNPDALTYDAARLNRIAPDDLNRWTGKHQ